MNVQKTDYRYILYIRRSQDSEDRQVDSLKDQRKEMMSFAQTQGLDIVKIIEESASAKRPGRKGFNEMLEIISDGEADAILCWKLNRLSRNQLDGGQVQFLLTNKIIKHIQTYEKGYLPTDNTILMAIELGMATQYSINLSVDVNRGLRQKAERGWYPISHLPVGYIHVKKKRKNGSNKRILTSDTEILNDPDKFPIVEKMWRLILTGQYSIKEMHKKAQLLGLRNPKGNHYSMNGIRNMYNNEFYCGYFYYDTESNGMKTRIKGRHNPIVSQEEFQRIQKMIGRHGKPIKTNTKIYPFRGPIVCGECTAAITTTEMIQARCTECKYKFSMRHRTDCSKCNTDISEMNEPKIYENIYYHCTKKKGPCSQKSVSDKSLEKQIKEILGSIKISESFGKWAKEAFEEIHSEEMDSQKALSKINNKREQELITQSDNYVRMRARNELTEEEFHKYKQEVSNELELVRTAQKSQHDRTLNWFEIAENYLSFAEKAPVIFETGSVEHKKSILLALGLNQTLKDKKLFIALPTAMEMIKSIENNFISSSNRSEPNESSKSPYIIDPDKKSDENQTFCTLRWT